MSLKFARPLLALVVLGAALLGACAPTATPSGTTLPPAAFVPAPVRSVPKTVRLGQEANGSIVDLRVGDTLELRLPGNPSTGFSWMPTFPLGPVLAQQGAPRFEPSSTGLGANGQVVLRYRAVAPGELSLSLVYGRPFGSSGPVQTFALALFVR